MPRFTSIISMLLLLTATTSLVGCKEHKPADVAIFQGETYTVYADSVTDGHHWARALSRYELESNFNPGDSVKRLSIPRAQRIKALYSSGSRLVDAVHNLSTADLDTIVTSTASTARLAYIIDLSLAYLDPERSKALLRDRVDADGRIRQGRTLGGGWPVGTDAIAWASAAWSIYEVNGDRHWLREAYKIVTKTLEIYATIATDPATGLTTGLASDPGYSSAIAYPAWMTPAEIAASAPLSNSVLTARAYAVAARMASELALPAGTYESAAAKMREAININLWMPNRSCYSQYLYCQPYPIASAVTDNLAQGLALIFDIPTAEMRDAMLRTTPVTDMGIPAMYPQMADTLVNPSNALVPAVESLWSVGASKAGNMTMVYRTLYALIRTAALNLGNYPCVDINDGTVPGSVRLYSHDALTAAANLGAIYRSMLGMNFTTYGIEMRPRVAMTTPGEKHIQDFAYRDATLDINITGTGSVISSFSIDSIEQTSHVIPANLRGKHTIDIVMAGNIPHLYAANVVTNATMPLTPEVVWPKINQAKITRFVPGDIYEVFINGVLMEQILTDNYTMFQPTALTALSFMPVQDEMYPGWASKPALFMPKGYLSIIPADSLAYPGTSLIDKKPLARQFAETTESRRSRMAFTFEAPDSGTYWLQAVYSNGHAAPWVRSDFCAIRRIRVNGIFAPSPLVMPPTAKDDWTVTSTSNMVALKLRKGHNRISIDYHAPYTINGHRTLNTALIQKVLIYRVE